MENFPVPWTARTSEKVTSDWQAKQCPLLGYHAIVVSFVVVSVQWNLVIAKGQGTGEICSLQQVFVISNFFFTYFAIIRAKKIFSLYRGFTLSGYCKITTSIDDAGLRFCEEFGY